MSNLPRTLSVLGPALPLVDGQPALRAVRLSGREGLNALFCYELLLESPGDADLDLDAFIGREIHCRIALDDGLEGVREINALVTEAAFLGEAGRHAQYLLTLRPWLHLAELRTDCRIFQDLTVVQILEALLARYPFPVCWRLAEHYPPRDYQTQFNESDFAFFERLCQEWGIGYHFEHAGGVHRLVLGDGAGAFCPAAGRYRDLDFHPPGWKLDAEYVHSFVPMRRLVSARYASREYDYMRPRADLSVSQGGDSQAEVYNWHDSVGGSHWAQPRAGRGGFEEAANDPFAEGRQLALLRLQALRADAVRANGCGPLRGLAPGSTFRLHGHPRQEVEATEYLALDTRFLIEEVGADSNRREHWRVNLDFTAHPLAEPLRPALVRPKPVAVGPQVARVVGPAGQNLWTDALGRIKVQFPWDREGAHDAHSSCWLRVSAPWAGNQLGGVFLPRIGQEVIVSFIGGDADLPICTGRVHDRDNLPPWALPGQAALSGFRSRELTEGGGNAAAGRSNHLVLDDTPDRIQAQLRSDHQCSVLSLGCLARIEDHAGRKEERGEGFELRTDGHGVLRAARGMLITTEARPNAANHALDMGETTARLAGAQEQHRTLAEAALAAKAQDAGDDQARVARALAAQNDAIRGGPGDPPAARFPELRAAQLALASAGGIAATTPGSLHLQAGGPLALTSEGPASFSALRRLLVAAREGVRLFALRHGMRWVAASGAVRLEARADAIGVRARGAVRITSSTTEIRIAAPKRVVVNGGGSFSEWSSAGIVHGTPGRWVEHAASHLKTGPVDPPE
ncbi:type VI secretion system Vgr family protein [Variovorax paradoxus]|uniref:type VI secretion system Vgr family protein n=1 Tax=Variovorax paradoxus TaxID=34073 RepID=UPI0019344591|nr:type VI secretion system tip protein VgrG [Variovorax paradoxus]